MELEKQWIVTKEDGTRYLKKRIENKKVTSRVLCIGNNNTCMSNVRNIGTMCTFCSGAVEIRLVGDIRYLISNGNRYILCKGKNNTCITRPRHGQYCGECRTDENYVPKHEKGEIRVTDNIRRKWDGGYWRKLCIANNNTCNSATEDKLEFCRGHKNNTRKYNLSSGKKGDVVTLENGEKRIHGGTQVKMMCSINGCETRAYDGQHLCKLHHPRFRCNFTDGITKCDTCKIDKTEYCARHSGGIFNPKIRSKWELLIHGWLKEHNIDHECNPIIRYNKKRLYPDFIITDCNVFIEFDGIQHFEAVKIWGDEEGLLKRQEKDTEKDNWIRETKALLLRISPEDDISVVLLWFFENMLEFEPGTIVSTKYIGYLSRDYTFIDL